MAQQQTASPSNTAANEVAADGDGMPVEPEDTSLSGI